MRLLAGDAFCSALSKLAKRFESAAHRHCNGKGTENRLRWTSSERACFDSLMSKRRPVSADDWQQLADALGTGRSGEALRFQSRACVAEWPAIGEQECSMLTPMPEKSFISTNADACVQLASPCSTASPTTSAPPHAPSAALTSFELTLLPTSNDEASANHAAPCTVDHNSGNHPELDVQDASLALYESLPSVDVHPNLQATHVDVETECKVEVEHAQADGEEEAKWNADEAADAEGTAEAKVTRPLTVTCGVQTDSEAFTALGLQSERLLIELLTLRKQHEELALRHAQLTEHTTPHRRARAVFLGDVSVRKTARVGHKHQAELPREWGEDGAQDAAHLVANEDVVLEMQLTHNAALLARSRARNRRAWPDGGGRRIDLGSTDATRLCELIHNAGPRDARGRLIVGGTWDEANKCHIGGRIFPGYSEYQATHAHKHGKKHNGDEQQRHTVVFSPDNFGFAREHVRSPALSHTNHQPHSTTLAYFQQPAPFHVADP